jgi:adenosylmethionine-8-amino-7-oxononanoate aminotransferase
VRGRGYFIGIELVANRRTRAPFPAAAMLHARIGRAAFRHGLICYPCTGNVNGIDGDTVILAPPYNATADELEALVAMMSAAIRDALASPD